MIAAYGGIQSESQHLDTICRDRAAWGDTYDFVETSDPKIVAENLEDASLLALPGGSRAARVVVSVQSPSDAASFFGATIK